MCFSINRFFSRNGIVIKSYIVQQWSGISRYNVRFNNIINIVVNIVKKYYLWNPNSFGPKPNPVGHWVKITIRSYSFNWWRLLSLLLLLSTYIPILFWIPHSHTHAYTCIHIHHVYTETYTTHTHSFTNIVLICTYTPYTYMHIWYKHTNKLILMLI